MNSTEELEFRGYEHRLDNYYKSLDLWGRPRPEALYSIMTVLDAILLVPLISPAPPAMSGGMAQKLKSAEDGVAQSVRWLVACGDTTANSTLDGKLIEEGHFFSMHAAEYANIADFFKMYGRGWATAKVDLAVKSVRFDPVKGAGRSDVVAWYEQAQSLRERGLESALAMKADDILAAQRAYSSLPYELSDGHIVIKEFPVNFIDRVFTTLKPHEEAELLPIKRNKNMIGFTIEQYWQFMLAITAWSQALVMRYKQCFMNGVPQNTCMPTQVINEDHLVETIRFLSNLPVEIVRSILDRLTLKPSAKADIIITPFLRGGGVVCWSPAIILKYRHERNLLKMMARGTKEMRDHAATVNGERCRQLGVIIGNKFAKYGYNYKLDISVTDGNDATDIDVLLFNAKFPTEVLLVESKALVAPDEINEVYEATQALRHAQEQLARAKKILEVMSSEQKNKKAAFVKWDSVRKIYGVVVCSDGEPHSIYDHQLYPAVNVGTLRSRFRSQDFRKPSRFWQACVDRPWLAKEIRIESKEHADIVVDGITFQIPMTIVDHAMDNASTGRLAALERRINRGD